jgi:hypothetical protein
VIDFRLGAVLLLLLPGLASYCAFYGIFGRFGHFGVGDRGRAQRRVFAPIPPAPGSVQSLTVIVASSVVAHVLLMIASIVVFPQKLDRLQVGGWPRGAHDLALFAGIELALALAIFIAITGYLRRLSFTNALPRWLYGWATDLANKLDDDSKIAVAVVLTRYDLTDKSAWAPNLSVTYIGAIQDLSLAVDGSIRRINLADAQRFLIDLRRSIAQQDQLPLATFDLLSIEADQIRNVSFEIVDRPVDPVPDLLANGLRRIYAGR